MQSTDAPEPQPTPTHVGTDDEQPQHRDVPTPAEHVARMHAERPDDCISN